MTEVFHIVPASLRWGTALLLLLPVVIIAAVMGGVAYSLISGSRKATFEVSNEGLRLRGDFYGRMIPKGQLRLDGVARIEINDGPYHPTLRTNGAALPGYRAGWFRVRNGRKALLFVTDPSNVVLVPTTGDYDVLLTVTEPDRFVERLRALAGPAPTAPAPLP